MCLADAGIVRVTYFPGAVPEDEPSYAVSPGYSAPGAEIREYDEDGKLLQVGGYPFIDLFAVAKWKRMRIFVKMQHLNDDLIGGRNYFSVAHYPLTKRFLKVGFSWSFYD